jgi:hypothetical protein
MLDAKRASGGYLKQLIAKPAPELYRKFFHLA